MQVHEFKSDASKVLHKILETDVVLFYKETLKLSDDITVVYFIKAARVQTEMEKYFSNINFVIQDHANYPEQVVHLWE